MAEEHKTRGDVPSPMVAYLANLIYFTRVDRILTLAEEDALDMLAGEIGATPQDLSAARTLVDENRHRVLPLERLSDSVRNLEDMVFLAVLDDTVELSEKETLAAFGRRIGITRSQFQAIAGQARRRVARHLARTTACPACQAALEAGSRFCTQCGQRVTPHPPPLPPSDDGCAGPDLG